MTTKLEDLAAVTVHANYFGIWLECDDSCSSEDTLALAKWLRSQTVADEALARSRDSIVRILEDLANRTTEQLFRHVQDRIDDVTGGEMASLSLFLDLPNTSPLWDKLEDACQDIKETWEDLGLFFMDLDELLGRWAYVSDSPEECYDDIAELLTELEDAKMESALATE